MKRMLLFLFLFPLLFAQQQGLPMELGRQLEVMEGTSLGRISQTCGSDDAWYLFGPAFMMLLVVSFSITVVYLLGAMFDSPMLSALAKQEGYEIALTVMIFIGFFSLWGLMQYVVLGAQGADEGLMGSASNYSKIMIMKISKDIVSLGLFNTALYMYYTAPVKLGKSLHSGIHMNMGAVLRPLIDGIGSASTLLSVALGEWLANLSLLCFIKSVAIPVLFPAGLLLRSVPQLRGGGNALIAFSFALFFIYPMMLTLNYEAYKLRYGKYESALGTPVQNMVSLFISKSGFFGISMIVVGIKAVTGTLIGPLFIASAIAILLQTLVDTVYTVFILSFFLGLVNVFVTLTFAKELARFLGTEINVSAFIKLL